MDQFAEQNLIMETITQILFTGWNLMRWLRLALGSFMAYQAILLHDTMAGMIAVFFLFQALTNTGCCGSQGCAAPVRNTKDGATEDVQFEEIKSK